MATLQARLTDLIAAIGADIKAINTAKVSRGEGWIDLRKQSGVVGDGLADDSAAINAVFAAAGSNSVYGYGSFKINSTVNVSGPCNLSQATFTWGNSSAGTAVVVGGVGGSALNKPIGDIILPRVVNSKIGVGWAQTNTSGGVGVRIQQLYSATVRVPSVSNFDTGLLMYGETIGVAYCQIFLGALENNRVNFKMDTDGAGWVNQNIIYGGRFSHYSGEGISPVVGVKHIMITRTIGASGAPNTNTFLSPSIESVGIVEYNIDMDRGLYNCFYNARFEMTNGAPTVRWGDEAKYNEIDHGYVTGSLAEVHVTGSIGNSINFGRASRRSYGGANGGVFENLSSTSSSVITILRAGGVLAGDDPTTAYASKFGADSWRQKAYSDAFDRLSLVNGVMRFGQGTATPAVGFHANNTSLFVTGFTFPATDATYDLGAVTLYRWRSLFLSGGLSRGFRSLTGTANIGSNDSTIFYNSATACTATLPSAVTFAGREYLICNSGAGTVTIAATAGTVERTTLLTGEKVTMQSDGTNWRDISTLPGTELSVNAIVASGGDQTSRLNTWLATTTPVGVKRAVGDFSVSDNLSVPAGTYLDLTKAKITQTGTNKVTISLGAGATIVGGELIGKGTDYVSGGSPLAMGISAAGDSCSISETILRNFSGAAIRGYGVTNFKISNVTVVGVGSPTIVAGDGGPCNGILIDLTSKGVSIDGADISNVCQGIQVGRPVTHVSITNTRIHDVLGQHACYIQNATGLNIAGLDIWTCYLNGLKIQKASTDTEDDVSGSIVNVNAADCLDTGLIFNNTASNLSGAYLFRGFTVSNISTTGCKRGFYFGSMIDSVISNVSAFNSSNEAFTFVNSQRIEGSNFLWSTAGRFGLLFNLATGSTQDNIRIRGLRGINAAQNNDGTNIDGIQIAKGSNIILDDLTISATNGFMRYALFMATSTAGDQETFTLRNANFSGSTVSARFQSAVTFVRDWANNKFTGTIMNEPTWSLSTTSDFEISVATKGLILKSANGTRWRITVNNDGSLQTTGL